MEDVSVLLLVVAVATNVGATVPTETETPASAIQVVVAALIALALLLTLTLAAGSVPTWVFILLIVHAAVVVAGRRRNKDRLFLQALAAVCVTAVLAARVGDAAPFAVLVVASSLAWVQVIATFYAHVRTKAFRMPSEA